MKDKELANMKEELKLILPELGKHKIEELRRVIDRHYEKRFKGKRKIPKYGSLNKGFTEQQLQAFFMKIDSTKFRLLFEYQAYMGLRIGEVCRVKVSDINFATRELTIRTEKAKTLDTLIIPQRLFDETIAFIRENAKEIESHENYLFFTKTEQSQAGNVHIGIDYARNRFRQYVVLAGLDEVYDVSEEEADRAVRHLHRLTTHSLRHYAITRFAKGCNGNLVLTSRFARHHEPNTTMTYIAKDKDELYGQMDRVFH